MTEDDTFRVLSRPSLAEMDRLNEEWIDAMDGDYDHQAFLWRHGWTIKEWEASGRE